MHANKGLRERIWRKREKLHVMSAYAKAAEEQGEVVRKIKEAIKADPAAHTKEELDEAVAKLKELKAKADDPMNALEDPVTKVSCPLLSVGVLRCRCENRLSIRAGLSPLPLLQPPPPPPRVIVDPLYTVSVVGHIATCPRVWRGRAARIPWGFENDIAMVRTRFCESACQILLITMFITMSITISACMFARADVLSGGCGLFARPARAPDT